MKVAILAGGFGTRISEDSHLKPKPMIEVGGLPILLHIMNHYSQNGFNEFVILAGYKQHIIKEYFADYPKLPKYLPTIQRRNMQEHDKISTCLLTGAFFCAIIQ
jgi:glucose-1-phosphate cytidylyltransferase